MLDYEKLWLELKAYITEVKEEKEKTLHLPCGYDYYDNGFDSGSTAVAFDFFDKMNELESK